MFRNVATHGVFIDESGSAGANLLDAQPVFVMAAIGARVMDIARLNAGIRALKRQYGFPEDAGLKASELIRGPQNALMSDESQLGMTAGMPIGIEGVERAFCIAALIVGS